MNESANRAQLLEDGYCLFDTQRENGCLRVIPGTHRKRHPLHAEGVIHDDAQKLATQDLSHPVFQSWPDEVDIPVRAGDLVIGDSRIFHAAHPNDTDEPRTVITLWYHPTVGKSMHSIALHWAVQKWPQSPGGRGIFGPIPKYFGDAWGGGITLLAILAAVAILTFALFELVSAIAPGLQRLHSTLCRCG